MAHVSDSVFVSQEHLVLDLPPPSSSSSEEASASASEVELKKKRLLEELESVIPSSLGVGAIQVIDETALVGSTFHLPPPASAPKKSNKHSRRRNPMKKEAAPNEEGIENTVPVAAKKTKRYSRKEMEALRNVKIGQQRKLWRNIYKRLKSEVGNEYDTLAAAHPLNNNNNHKHYTPHPQCLPNKKPAPPILGVGAANGRWRCAESHENMDSSENVSLVEPSLTHNLIDVDGCSNLEESSEKDDSEDDYASIQRPAFLVEGEPNFDAGPPEDGWEYLRRVRWEAAQIPKVKVAKLDKSKLNKEQSAYMPKIPDIPVCPEHLMPLKQWEDVFLAEFSALRANLSSLEGSNNLHPVHFSNLLGNNLGKSASVMNSDVLLHHLSFGTAIDQPTNLTAEDKDTALPPKNPASKTSVDQTGSRSPTLPLLSAILGMDSVARVSMLMKRISLLEPADTIPRNDCMWLFALCAAVDTPLHADTSAALRGLLRKCASIRATKAELDEEAVMLNILATISGRYFGQSEN
ncbi:hypothetical protein RIF29_22927 [Crotalaria pallida]|uniref:Gem-associated protein 2 n=1 Tax=Crotalaria pallida TaxID=3830 RepID=A0AAN9F7M5_CROPI